MSMRPDSRQPSVSQTGACMPAVAGCCRSRAHLDAGNSHWTARSQACQSVCVCVSLCVCVSVWGGGGRPSAPRACVHAPLKPFASAWCHCDQTCPQKIVFSGSSTKGVLLLLGPMDFFKLFLSISLVLSLPPLSLSLYPLFFLSLYLYLLIPSLCARSPGVPLAKNSADKTLIFPFSSVLGVQGTLEELLAEVWPGQLCPEHCLERPNLKTRAVFCQDGFVPDITWA